MCLTLLFRLSEQVRDIDMLTFVLEMVICVYKGIDVLVSLAALKQIRLSIDICYNGDDNVQRSEILRCIGSNFYTLS